MATQLNAYLKRTNNLTEDIVVVSSLVEADGSPTPQANNKLLLLLTNIEKDTTPKRAGSRGVSFDGRALQSTQPLYLNLYVMLAANFAGANYAEALKFISRAIGFFQVHSTFDRQGSPDMDRRIERLVLDIENLSIQDLSNLWGLLGGKYLPSVYYRVRMISVTPDSITGQIPIATRPAPSVQG
ncbi:MAG: DUF4255 domain-containing protein [Pseudomonadota bacterium]|nr:DUF4255 domain-containing protein [Pseudomonadota bacterium]